ncbi:3,4-dihydroxy-2-butanone-4-phosphate synthase [Zavarzinia aquatilis]|uniref:3,4-dihydroxy-2-butanone 4-phosphate synthase n=1 Tax=Zavarzinia aquatilis TaxID=2211142 RepID=A0A317DXX6_9PROT|nr:3,4-dihydroxy-2-butanone-4-phosphate synthase [Zavarzinia aquatilis]PWR19332.1 3,4-dihydroxy-2-butanone-4-phosphate synthase [Zavarzinia aquatilis]
MSEWTNFLSPIEDIIEDARNGRMFILVDHEDRENEGDLVIPAQMATPEAINFMARYGRGLICLSMTRQRVEQLGLTLMSRDNLSRHQTAFTVSIEAREGVTTGISAHDRAHTVAVAIDPSKGPQDLATPGHVFPLVARDGGVLVRAGHTEAAVDVSRLAGLNPSGVICEIMNDDGTMARLPDLVKFAQFHGLKIGTIADLISYRRRWDNLVSNVGSSEIDSAHGGQFRALVYRNKVDGTEHLALVKGDISGPAPVLVRMHTVNVFEDLLADRRGRISPLSASMEEIGREGRGVVVLIRDSRQTALSDIAAGRTAAVAAGKAPGANELRDYGIGAQILLDLGVHEMILLSNTRRTIVGLEGYDLKVTDHRQLNIG